MKLYENIERQAIILLRGKLNHPNVSATTGQRERTSMYVRSGIRNRNSDFQTQSRCKT